MNKPLISVITVTLNCVNEAIRTANSVLIQDFPNYEYIVKDGGSIDGTPDALMSLGISVHQWSDRGIFDAMNQALTLCSGEYVYFLNAGDIFVNDKVLSNVAQYIAQAPDIDLYYGDVLLHQEHSYAQMRNQIGLGPLVRPPNRLSRFYLFRWGLCHQTWFVRRELYRQRPFNTDLTLLSDYDWLLDHIFTRRIRYQHIPILIADYSSGGQSERRVSQRLMERRRVIRRFFPLWQTVLFEGVRLLGHSILYIFLKSYLVAKIHQDQSKQSSDNSNPPK